MHSYALRTLVVGGLVLGGLSGYAGHEWVRQATVEQDRHAPQPGKASTATLSLGDNVWEHLNPNLPDLQGVSHRLDEWKGKTLLINFWASWCAPCQYEIPDLVTLQKRYGGNGLQVLGVGIDKVQPLRNVARSLGINYPVLVADDVAGRRLLAQFGNPRQIVPFSVAVDRYGNLIYSHLGEVDEEVLEQYIAPLLGQ